MSDVLLWTPAHGHTSVGRPARTYLHKFFADTGCTLEDPSREMEVPVV